MRCLVSIVLYRGWFNSFERWTDFERKFGLDEGQLLDESFSAANFVEAFLSPRLSVSMASGVEELTTLVVMERPLARNRRSVCGKGFPL